MINISFNFNLIEECLPPNKTPCLCLIEKRVNDILKKTYVQSGFFENSIFWNSIYDDASVIEMESKDQVGITTFKVVAWTTIFIKDK